MKLFRWYLDKNAETKWLNEMSAQGWALCGFKAGLYTFEPCEKGQWTYQIDFSDRWNTVDPAYRELMGDLGAELVQMWGYWIFLRRPANMGAFDLYTDADSVIAHYKKIARLYKSIALIELCCLLVEIVVFAMVSNFFMGLCTALVALLTLSISDAALQTQALIARLQAQRDGKDVPIPTNYPLLILSLGLIFNCVGSILARRYAWAGGISITAICTLLYGAARVLSARKQQP